ncbi:type VII secretion protein EccE [Actinoplanes sp. NPDC051494]|uniref:type VII secretion protein EccE n=1 Tax=Actinoplanes sp. NPDC051494 TaxID=3363907 RepID=UPI0037ADC09B
MNTQVAAAAVLIGAVNGPIALAAGVFVAIVTLSLTWIRLRGRWAFEWIGTATRYSGRRHVVSVDTTSTALLEFVAPGSHIEQTELAGDPAAIIVDSHGLTAILELGDPTGMLAEDVSAVPSPAGLLPPAGTDHPPCRIQVLLTGAPAPSLRAGGGTPANSYRQLTEGRLLGYSRALLAVRVLRAEGWSDEDLHRALSGLVRKLLRRLAPTPARPLGETAALRVIAELAHDDGVGTAQESWPGLQVGGMSQATFRLSRWPDLRIETSQRLVARMLSLPAAATTVALGAGPRAVVGKSTAIDLTIRLAAPDAASLSVATQALRKLLANERAAARRLDGEHLDGLTATLPLAIPTATAVPGHADDVSVREDLLDGLDLPVSNAGLMVGQNRHRDPVIARLFRPEQTRALLVGGVRCAQLMALRAMALGARVVVQTARPQAWEPFIRGAAVPGEAIAVIPPGRAVEIPPGSALHPLLVLVDIGPVGADNRPGAGWQATMVVRDDFSPADADVASRADLLLVQPLRPEEAALVGAALGLGETAEWLTRIRQDMLGVINRRAVRWAVLSPTPIESQLIGPPVRG